MKKTDQPLSSDKKNRFLHQGGRTYFSKEAERRFYFTLTIIMLLLGLLLKTGVF